MNEEWREIGSPGTMGDSSLPHTWLGAVTAVREHAGTRPES